MPDPGADTMGMVDTTLFKNLGTTISNVQGGIYISMIPVTTPNAPKLGLRAAVRLTREPTGVAPLRGVSGVHEDHGYAAAFRLVVRKLLELVEAPVRSLGSVLFAPNPLPQLSVNAFEILKGQSSLRVFGKDNQLLADPVVGIFLKPGLLLADLFKPPLCTLGSHALKDRSTLSVPLPISLNSFPRYSLAIRCHYNVSSSEVYPEHTSTRGKGFWFFYIAGGIEIPLSIPVDQITLTHLRLEQFELALPRCKGNADPALSQDPDRYCFMLEVVGEDAVIIADRSMLLEDPLSSFVIELVGIANLSDAPNCDLSAEIEEASHIGIDRVVQIKLLEDLRGPGHVTDPIAGPVTPLQSLLEKRGLSGIRKELELCDQFHTRT